MPMEPVDTLMMFKPPTVDDVVGTSNVMFKPAIKTNKPNERKMTIAGIDTSKTSEPPKSPTEPMVIPRTRHFSISETFGSPMANFNWGLTPQNTPSINDHPALYRRERGFSVNDSETLRELLRSGN